MRHTMGMVKGGAVQQYVTGARLESATTTTEQTAIIMGTPINYCFVRMSEEPWSLKIFRIIALSILKLYIHARVYTHVRTLLLYYYRTSKYYYSCIWYQVCAIDRSTIRLRQLLHRNMIVYHNNITSILSIILRNFMPRQKRPTFFLIRIHMPFITWTFPAR